MQLQQLLGLAEPNKSYRKWRAAASVFFASLLVPHIVRYSMYINDSDCITGGYLNETSFDFSRWLARP